MYKNYKNLDHQFEKKEQYKIRVTTFIQGELKNTFLNDCIKRGITEADLARDIFDAYYTIVKEKPSLKEKEIKEIKTYVIGKLRL